MLRTPEEHLKFALDHGFSQTGILNLDALVFMPEVRAMCAEDKCHHFGKTWCCPPGCGTLEEITERVKGYKHGILLQMIGHMEDEFDFEVIENTSTAFRKSFQSLIVDLRKEGVTDLLPMGAGGCGMCDGKCTYPDAPCRHPDLAFPSMEAYGLWVAKVCELSGLPYNNGKLTMTFIGCYLYN